MSSSTNSGRLGSKKKSSTRDLRQQFSDLQNMFGVSQKENLGSADGHIVYPPLPQNIPIPEPTALRKQRPAKTAEHKDRSSIMSNASSKNANFLSDLSDNLLVECRKLTAENKQLKLDFEEREREVVNLTNQVNSMTLLNQKLSEQEEKLKDQTWELEAQLQQLRDDMGHRTTELGKLSRGKLENDNELQSLRTQLEEYRLVNNDLTRQLQSTKNALELEINDLKQRNLDLNDENDQLHGKIISLSDELKTSKEQVAQQSPKKWSVPNLAPDSSFDDTGDFDDDNALLTEPPSSPVKHIQGRNVELEKDTLQANLAHANRLIMKLRSSAIKYKSERESLKKQLKDRPTLTTTKVKPVHITKDSRKKIIPSKVGRSQHTSYEISSHTDEGDDSWENYDLSMASRDTFDKTRPSPLSSMREDSVLPDSNSSSDEDVPGMILADEISDLSDFESSPLPVVNDESIRKYAEDHGLVLLSADEYKRLTIFSPEKSSEQEEYSMVRAARDFNILALPNETPAPVTVDSIETLTLKCQAQGLVALKESRYNELRAKADPSEQELIRKVEEKGLVVLPQENYQKMKAVIDAPSQDHLTFKANALGLTLIPINEHTKLTSFFEKPSLDRSIDVIRSEGYEALPAEKLQKLQEKAKHVMSTDEMVRKLQAENLTVLPSEELWNLKHKAESPSREDIVSTAAKLGLGVCAKTIADALSTPKDAIVSKAKEYGLVALPESQFRDITNPHKEQIAALASSRGLFILDKAQHEKLVSLSQTPSKEFIVQHALTHNLVPIPAPEHAKLVETVRNPSLEFLKQHALKENLVLLPAAEHSALLRRSIEPTEDVIKGHGEKLGFVVLPKKEHDSIVNPRIEEIQEKAQSAGLVAVPQEEFDQLRSVVEQPSKEFIKTHAHSVGLEALEKAELDSLRSPDVASVMGHAEAHGRAVVFKAELEELSRKAKAPTREEISAAAEAYNLVVVPEPEFGALQERADHPSKDTVVRSLPVYGLVEMSKQDYDSMEKQVASPSLEFLSESLKKRGYVSLPEQEFAKLQESLESPDEQFLKSKAVSLGLSVVPIAQLESLKENVEKPSIAFLTERAKTHGYSLVSNDDMASLKEAAKSPLNRSPVKTPPASAGLTINTAAVPVSVPSFSPVTSSPVSAKRNQYAFESVDDLKKRCADQGLIVLSKSSYEGLIVSSKRGLTFVELREKIKQHGYIAVSQEEYDSMKRPNVEFSSEFLRSQGYAVLPKEEYNALLNEIKSPTLEYLSQKAEGYGRRLVKISEHEALVASAASFAELKKKQLTKQEILSEAPKHELVALPELEFAQMKDQLNSPSRELIVEKAPNHKLVAVDESEYVALKESALHPSLDLIKSEAAAIGMMLLSSKDHDSLQNKAKHLKLDEIHPIAASFNHTCVSNDELASLKDKVANPSTETLRATAAAQGMVLLPKDTFTSLQDNIEKPSLSYLTKKSEIAGMVLIPESEHDALVNPSTQALVDMGQSRNLVVVDKDEFDAITDFSSDKFRAKNDVVVLSREEHESLTNPSLDLLKFKLHELGFIVVSEEDYKNLNEPTKEKIVELAPSRGLVAIETEAYHKLLSPSKADIMAEAKKLGLIALELSDYHQLVKPSAEVVRELAPQFGLVVLGIQEHQKLLNDIVSPTRDYVTAKADDHDLVAVDKDEYSMLLRKTSNPSLEYLVAACDALGLVVLNKFDHAQMLKSLQHPTKEVVLSEAPVHGLRAVPEDELAKLQTAERIVLSQDNIHEVAKSMGLAVLSWEDYTRLMANQTMDKGAIEQKALLLGYELVPASQANASPPSPAKSTTTTTSEEFHDAVDDLNIVGAGSRVSVVSEYVDAVSTLPRDNFGNLDSEDVDEDWLRERAYSLGFKIVPVDDDLSGDDTSVEEDLKARRVTLRPHDSFSNLRGPSIDEITRQAEQLNHVVLSKAELDHLKGSNERSIAALETISREELEEWAQKMGLVVTTTAALDRLRSRGITAQELAAKAAELNLKLVGEDEVTSSNIESLAKMKNSLLIPKSAYIATTVAKEPDVNKVVVVPATYYNKLVRSHNWYKESHDPGSSPTSPKAPLPQIPEKSTAFEKPVGFPHHSRNTSITDSVIAPPTSLDRLLQSTSAGSIHSTTSINTEISFTDRAIVPAITQTMIGEYLYKYYRRLGPFSSISESRHERYFWIHPYSMTLYWSTVNPVMGNPSDNKIRAAAILGVESVDDNNPLPVGLYHKSILVHCSERSIKLTCPTRQRHNIWYNALRYLIHKSVDYGNDEDEQYDLSYQLDHKTEMERSSTFRHSQPRKTVLGYRTSSNPLPRSATSQSMLSSITSRK